MIDWIVIYLGIDCTLQCTYSFINEYVEHVGKTFRKLAKMFLCYENLGYIIFTVHWLLHGERRFNSTIQSWSNWARRITRHDFDLISRSLTAVADSRIYWLWNQFCTPLNVSYWSKQHNKEPYIHTYTHIHSIYKVYTDRQSISRHT